MTLGEHLDELRAVVIRSLLALVVAAIPCIWLAPQILKWIAAPLFAVARSEGQPDSFLSTSPIEAFVVYVKVVLIAALILAGPYVLWQLWSFIGAGLYPNERSWIYKLAPLSGGLFLLGVAFMYVFVLVLSLKFLVGFSTWLPAPSGDLLPVQEFLLGAEQHPDAPIATQPVLPSVPVLAADPVERPPGGVWINLREQRLKIDAGERVLSLSLQRDDQRALMTAHFKIADYVGFVLVLTIAFGAAFQVPLVVLFLVRTGLVPIAQLRSYRKFVIAAIVIIAGIIAPPDFFSHILLAIPMYLLFEIGLLVAGRGQARTVEPPTT